MRWRVVAATLVLAAACTNADVYIYTARKYEAASACLDPYAPVDQINGAGENSNCPPACFTLDDATYVSTVCPPLPANAVQLPGNAPACIAAARLLDASCGDEGGVLDAGANGG